VTPQQAREQIGYALKRAAPGSDIDAIDPNAELRDVLDLDSLDFLQFVQILSDTSGHRIDEDDYPELATLNSSIRFLAARLPPGGQDGSLPGTNWVHGESEEPAPARSGKSERASRIGRKA
jgi:acyl carrier protein